MHSKQKGKPRTYGLKLALLRGKRVDAQLKAWVDGKTSKRRDVLTKQIIEACDTWGWKPLEAQVAVGIASARLATAFDLLCQNHRRELVLIEVKTGFEGYWDKSNGQKLEPKAVSHVVSSPKTHAIIQAETTARYLEATRNIGVDHVYVVRSYAEGCERIVVREPKKPPSRLREVMSVINRNTALYAAMQAKLAADRKRRPPRWLPAVMKTLDEAIRQRQS